MVDVYWHFVLCTLSVYSDDNGSGRGDGGDGGGGGGVDDDCDGDVVQGAQNNNRNVRKH